MKKHLDARPRVVVLMGGIICALIEPVWLFLNGEREPAAMSIRPSHLIPAWILLSAIMWAVKRWTNLFASKKTVRAPFSLPENAFRVKPKLYNVVILNGVLIGLILTTATILFLPLGKIHLPSPYFFVYFALLVVLHEFSHALGWMLGGVPRRAIRFGIMWSIAAPFAHAEVATSMRVFRFALMLPTFTTGFLPLGIGWFTRDFDLVMASCWLLAGISGDLMMLLAGVAFHSRVQVMDHPSDLAFVILNKGHST